MVFGARLSRGRVVQGLRARSTGSALSCSFCRGGNRCFLGMGKMGELIFGKVLATSFGISFLRGTRECVVIRRNGGFRVLCSSKCRTRVFRFVMGGLGYVPRRGVGKWG